MTVMVMPALLKPFKLNVGHVVSNTHDVRSQLERQGTVFRDDVECLFNGILATKYSAHKVRLRCVSIQSLGFSDSVCLRDVYKKAIEKGWSLCAPDYLYRLLLLTERAIRLNSSAVFAMEPLLDDRMVPMIPALSGVLRDGIVKQFVRMVAGDPFTKYAPTTQVVFAESIK
jgi:hypothetical protein